MQVKGIELRNASVLVESEGDSTYKVSSVVNFSGESVNSFDTGEVKRLSDDAIIASWSRYSIDNLNVNYMTSDKTEMCNITDKISLFIESVINSKSLTENISL